MLRPPLRRLDASLSRIRILPALTAALAICGLLGLSGCGGIHPDNGPHEPPGHAR